MSTRRITALNNTGINSLYKGFFDEAICSFRMAMECLHTHSELEDTKGRSFAPECLELPTQAIPVDSVDVLTAAEASPHNTFDIYQTAFCFPRLNQLQPFQTEISVILFYNLALSHHLSGLAGREQSQMHLRQALKYYKLALTVFKSTPDLQLDGTCFAMVLGLLTNMGHVFTHFWNARDAAACRRHMQDLLHSTAIMQLSDADGEFFYAALEYSASHDAVAAPAA